MNNYLQEINKLADLLEKSNIPFEVHHLFDGRQIIYRNEIGNIVCDAICHRFSYGHEKGLLELMGLVDEEKVGDSVEGYLTAEEVFNRIKKYRGKYYGNH